MERKRKTARGVVAEHKLHDAYVVVHYEIVNFYALRIGVQVVNQRSCFLLK